VKPVLHVCAPVALTQQGSPMPPQVVQDVAPLLPRVQEKPVLHVGVPPNPPAPGQHAWPLPPQAVQDCIAPVPVQAKPVSQVPPRVKMVPPPPAQQI
jgi:hypothetical protein